MKHLTYEQPEYAWNYEQQQADVAPMVSIPQAEYDALLAALQLVKTKLYEAPADLPDDAGDAMYVVYLSADDLAQIECAITTAEAKE